MTRRDRQTCRVGDDCRIGRKNKAGAKVDDVFQVSFRMPAFVTGPDTVPVAESNVPTALPVIFLQVLFTDGECTTCELTPKGFLVCAKVECCWKKLKVNVITKSASSFVFMIMSPFFIEHCGDIRSE